MPKIIIDDTDRRATYSDKGWDQRGSEFEFGATTHGTHFKGAHVTVRFIGHSVAVFGTIAEAGFFSKPSTSTYRVDGSSPVLYTAVHGKHAQYKQQFFHVANLSEGVHTLVVTSTSSTPFWLDYFEVETQDDPGSIPATQLPTLLTQTPTPSLSLPSSSESFPTASTDVAFPNSMSTPFITSAPSPHVPPASQNKPLIIDDTDAMVKYSGYWFVAGVLEGNQATSHGTQNKGATALLTFTGTAISVYGTITEAHQDVSSRVSTYSIDGAGLTTFTSPQPKSILYKQLFFQSPQLPHGQHTLVVTAGTGDAPFWLDYFEVYNPSASTRTYRHGSTFISPPSSEPSDPSTNHPVQLASKTSSHAGAIAGGVIGGLAALGVLITFLIIRRRRKSPAAYIPTAPNPDWTPGPTWTNEKLTIRHHMKRV